SGEQVVYNGNGNTVNVTGLATGTVYYARVYGYNGSGSAITYALQTATGNPASQQTTAANPPTQLVVLSLNNGNPVKVNQPFSITVQSQDASSNPQNVNLNTTVTISLAIGSGLLSGTVSGILTAGSNTVTISGLLYDTPEFGVQLQADATGGNTLDPA